MECQEFRKKLKRKEKAAWNSFVAVVRGFLGNHKDENYVKLVETLVKNYGKMGCRTLILINSNRTREHIWSSKANASIRINWTLNAATVPRSV